ncbi:MAG: lactonase family protein [Pirellulaceae bacterium]
MSHPIARTRLLATGCLILGALTAATEAHDMIVFVAAFAPGEEGAIYAYQLETTTGQLKLLRRTAGVEHPFFLALSPNKKFLYSIHAPGQFGGEAHEQVAAYQIVGRSGELKLLNHQSTRGSSSCYLDVDVTGKTLVVANYSTGSVASLPIHKDGSLGEITSFIQHAGTSVDPERQEGPHAHCAVVSPDNRFVYAADLGLDKVLSYRLDADAATLVPNQQSFVRTLPGAGPRHLTFHPNGRQMYVINELANSITLFDYDTESGFLIERKTISTLPEDFSAGPSYCADVKVTPNGRFLYGTNRGHDSIAVYRIGEEGQLTLVKNEPSLGQQPQNLAITPDGELLLCANMPGNNIVVFRIDPQTGGLSPVGEPISMPSPSCIMMLSP